MLTPNLVDGRFEYGRRGFTSQLTPRAAPQVIEDIIAQQTKVNEGISKSPPLLDGEIVRKAWFTAQMLLYGISCEGYHQSWNIPAMTKALSDAFQSPGGLQVSAEVQKTEERLKKRYPDHKKRHFEREQKRLAAAKEMERVKAAAAANGRSTATKATQTSKSEIQERRPPVPVLVAGPRDVESMETDNSDDESSVEGNDDIAPWQNARDGQVRTMNKLHDQLLADHGPGKNISGTWHLDCPMLTSKFCREKVDEPRKIIWNIPSSANDGNADGILIKFDMLAVEGVIRTNPLPDYLGKRLLFEWRGRRTADLELLCEVTNLGYVIFSSMHECWGTIKILDGAAYNFTGKKVDRILPSKSTTALNKEFEHYLDCLQGKGR